MPSQYFSWFVVDIEDWGSRPGAIQAKIQNALSRITSRALDGGGILPDSARRTSRGDGMILAFSADVPKERITDDFLKAVSDELELYNNNCPSVEAIRLRMSLHAGDAVDGKDQWAGAPVVLACRLVDSEVLHRVLTAATGNSLALIVSDSWYGAVIKEGHASGLGYAKIWLSVKNFEGSAWICVPGRSRPPGLLPRDIRMPSSVEQVDSSSIKLQSANVDQSFNSGIIIGGNVQGDAVAGDKIIQMGLP
jgi:hypothetical protein